MRLPRGVSKTKHLGEANATASGGKSEHLGGSKCERVGESKSEHLGGSKCERVGECKSEHLGGAKCDRLEGAQKRTLGAEQMRLLGEEVQKRTPGTANASASGRAKTNTWE